MRYGKGIGKHFKSASSVSCFIQLITGEPILKLQSVPARWLKPTFQPEEKEADSEPAVSSGQVVEMTSSPTDPSPKTQLERFKMAEQVCKDIASLISNTGGSQFKAGMKALKQIRAIFQRGEDAAVDILGRL